MILHAPAKVNLTLRVFDARPDGFHALDSIVVPLSLADKVSLDRADETTLELIPEPGVELAALPANPEANLAFRALRALERIAQRPLPTRIRLYKRIPLGGGLGGGSSDAAAVLMGINTLWGLGLDAAVLREIGAGLGYDVPLFLADGLVRMRGRGEQVERLRIGARPLWLVLANPGVHCPTSEVYHAFDRRPRPSEDFGLTADDRLCDTICLSLRAGTFEQVAHCLVNDLGASCFGLFRAVAQTADALRAAGCRGVTLCGSGATVFGLVRSREEGEGVLAHPALAGCWRACVQTLPDGVMAAHGPLTPIVMVRIHVGQPSCVAFASEPEG